ncbi:MAG: ABC transporter ATP-binding protein [Candidatus Competibacterales bacterium]
MPLPARAPATVDSEPLPANATAPQSQVVAALAFREVEHAFGSHVALDRVSFHIGPGETLCLFGPSGCGKTTALRIAAGLERPRRGQVVLADQVVSDARRFVVPEERGVGLLFQDYALFPHLTIEDNVAFGLKGVAVEERRRRARAWLARVALEDRRHAYPHMLSGGEQQRVALARALVPGPHLLLLDEPFSNLDTQLRRQVRDEVMGVLKEVGATALMVTHDPEEALYMGDRLALMERGRVLQQGDAHTLYFHPQTRSVAAALGDVNRLTGRVQRGQVATPLGVIDAKHLDEGCPVEVLVRSEGLGLVDAEGLGDALPFGAAKGVVTAVRPTGRISSVQVAVPDPTGAPCVLHIHVLGMTTLTVGSPVTVTLDPRLAFVFPVVEG